MKPFFPLLAIGLFFFGTADAQNAGDRIVVPARNSSRPRIVNVEVMNGGVTVKAYAGREVIVESRDAARSGRDRNRGPAEVDGMRRIELPGNAGLEVDEEDNVIHVRTHHGQTADILISVPVETSVKVRCQNGGDIRVEGVHGEVDADNLNGRVTLSGISGTAIAHSLNGSVKATMDRVDSTKPISFSTLNGEVDVTLPKDIRANFKMKTDNGEVYSDFDIKLDPSRNRPITEQTNSRDGRFRVKSDRTIYGTVNGGGQEASFTTFNGRISVHQK